MAPNYRLEMGKEMGSLSKASPCFICSGKNNFCAVHHLHMSTAWYNRQMSLLGNSTPMCHFCDIPGLNDIRDTARLFLGKYTLEETENKASEDIMTSIRGLHKLVLEHSATNGVDSTSSSYRSAQK